MFRKSILALTAVAALAGTAFTATDASAKPMKWKGNGWGYHHKHIGAGLALGIVGAAAYAATAPRCYEYVNRWGEIVARCRY